MFEAAEPGASGPVTLAPLEAVLYPSRAQLLGPGREHDIDIAETRLELHPDLPPVPAWGFGARGHLSSPGPLLEVMAGHPATLRWRNRLPASSLPGAPAALPFVTAVVDDPDGVSKLVQFSTR